MCSPIQLSGLRPKLIPRVCSEGAHDYDYCVFIWFSSTEIDVPGVDVTLGMDYYGMCIYMQITSNYHCCLVHIAWTLCTQLQLIPSFGPVSLTGEQDLHDVLSETIELAARWKQIGDAFRLHPGTLETIRLDQCDSQSRLREVILSWLQKSGYDYRRYGPPTWEWVVEAVRKPAGGNLPELAKKIAAKHLGTF